MIIKTKETMINLTGNFIIRIEECPIDHDLFLCFRGPDGLSHRIRSCNEDDDKKLYKALEQIKNESQAIYCDVSHLV